MGRKVKRVPLDFDWPLNTRWDGYVNPYGEPCVDCKGYGYTRGYQLIEKLAQTLLYGANTYVQIKENPEKPVEGVRFSFDHHYRASDYICDDFEVADRGVMLWKGILHKTGKTKEEIFQEEVMDDTTLEFIQGLAGGDLKQDRGRIALPAAKDVIHVMLVFAKAAGIIDSVEEEDKFTEWGTCSTCKGEGIAPDFIKDYESWAPTAPPKGKGYQIWETVSEGSPISPVFEKPEDLAQWMVSNDSRKATADMTYDNWLVFITKGQVAPTAIICNGKMTSGTKAVAEKKK